MLRLGDGVVPQLLLESIGDGVAVTDERGQLVFFNKAAVRILGVGISAQSPSQWADIHGVFLPDGVTRFPTESYPLVRALQGEEPHHVEMVIRNPVASENTVVSVSARPLKNPAGTIIGAVAVFRDITDLRESQRELALKNADHKRAQERQTELNAFVVHDLKSPLAGIIANTDFLQASSISKAEDRECLADIRAAAESMHRMVMDLLDIGASEDAALAITPSPMDVRAVLSEVAQSLCAQAGRREQRIDVKAMARIESFSADRELLQRTLRNLVDNCIKYGARGGLIELDARVVGSELELRVSDDGPEVPVHFRDKMFEKYTRIERDASGRVRDSRGLGLRFCRVAVEAHGGRIWVEDNEPKGARFCARLPLAPVTALQPPAAGQPRPRLLFIDDDDVIQRWVRRAAGSAGYEVLQALDGSTGLNLALKEPVDVILLDIRMPNMDGRDVLSHLKKNPTTADTPVIMHSASSNPGDRVTAIDLGAEDFIEKPFNITLLVQKMGQAIETARERRRSRSA